MELVDTENTVRTGIVAFVVRPRQERIDQCRRDLLRRSRRLGFSEKPVHDSVIFQLRKLK